MWWKFANQFCQTLCAAVLLAELVLFGFVMQNFLLSTPHLFHGQMLFWLAVVTATGVMGTLLVNAVIGLQASRVHANQHAQRTRRTCSFGSTLIVLAGIVAVIPTTIVVFVP